MTATQDTEPGARAVIAVSGGEAREFLAGLVTNSLDRATPETLVPAALLTPQGKIICEMLIGGGAGGGLLLEVAEPYADDLLKRLAMYRLRRKIGIDDMRGTMTVALGSGAPDPRHADLPARAFVPVSEASGDWAAYEAQRIALGVPEQGRDYGAEELYPADVNLDLMGGVDLKKGCFIGQEVVSRMHRRGSIRKRMARLTFEGPAPAWGAEITGEAGGAIGTVRSTSGASGIALVRIDRLEAAQGGLQADGTPVTVMPPTKLA